MLETGRKRVIMCNSTRLVDLIAYFLYINSESVLKILLSLSVIGKYLFVCCFTKKAL